MMTEIYGLSTGNFRFENQLIGILTHCQIIFKLTTTVRIKPDLPCIFLERTSDN